VLPVCYTAFVWSFFVHWFVFSFTVSYNLSATAKYAVTVWDVFLHKRQL